MTNLREAAQMALDALEQLQGGCTDSNDGTVEAITVWCPEVIESLQLALANEFNPDRDAMAVMVEEQQRMAKRIEELEAKLKEPVIDKTMAIRIATQLGWEPKREWQGLTDEELGVYTDKLEEFARAIEAKLKEKNT